MTRIRVDDYIDRIDRVLLLRRAIMGIMDNVPGADKLDDVADKAKDLAGKLPGGIGDKVEDIIEKVEDKLPGQDEAE